MLTEIILGTIGVVVYALVAMFSGRDDAKTTLTDLKDMYKK